jgi:hypothetical protein
MFEVEPTAPREQLLRGPVRGKCMEDAPYSSAFRIASHVILLLMAAAIVYSAAMAIIHWTGIGV